MSFLFIHKTLRSNNWKTRTAMNTKISAFVICVEVIIYLILHNLNDCWLRYLFNPSSANPTKWPNILKQFVGKLPTNCLSVFGHFVNLALKGLTALPSSTNLKKLHNVHKLSRSLTSLQPNLICKRCLIPTVFLRWFWRTMGLDFWTY